MDVSAPDADEVEDEEEGVDGVVKGDVGKVPFGSALLRGIMCTKRNTS